MKEVLQFLNKNRRIVLWVAAILAILAAAGAWQEGQNPDAADKSGQSVSANITASSLTHDQAAIIFAKERIQFDQDCGVIPDKITVKNGATLMFDNLHRDARIFKLDGSAYSIPGYGFKLLQLKSTKLPHVVKVECGEDKTAGEIRLQ